MNGWSQVIPRLSIAVMVVSAAEAYLRRPKSDPMTGEADAHIRTGWMSVRSQTDVKLII
jgi:hypothetical protein